MPNQFTHPWTSQEINFLKANVHKLTYKQMGKDIRRTPASIQSRVRYLPIQQKVKKYSVNSNFFKKWSANMAYTLGFIAADGNICHSGRSHILHIACDDRDIIEKIKLTLEYNGPVHENHRNNNKISFSLRICDRVVFDDLLKLGISERKRLTLNFPKIPNNLVRHFLRGYFDGDGCVFLRNTNKYRSPVATIFYTASLNMAQGIHNILSGVLHELYASNIQTRFSNNQTPYYTLSCGHKASLKLFGYMYHDTELYMERKFQKFIKGFAL